MQPIKCPHCKKMCHRLHIYYRPEIRVTTGEDFGEEWDYDDMIWEEAPCTGVECPHCSFEFPEGHIVYEVTDEIRGHPVQLKPREVKNP